MLGGCSRESPRHAKLTRNAHPVLLKNSTRSRPQGRNGDFSIMWFLWAAYLGSDRHNSHTSHKKTSGEFGLTTSTERALFARVKWMHS